jgi:hypothetical protein
VRGVRAAQGVVGAGAAADEVLLDVEAPDEDDALLLDVPLVEAAAAELLVVSDDAASDLAGSAPFFVELVPFL